MTRSGEKLYGNWQPDPPRAPMPFVWWVAVATASAMLIVSLIRGNW